MNQAWWPVRDGSEGLGYHAELKVQGGPAKFDTDRYIYKYLDT